MFWEVWKWECKGTYGYDRLHLLHFRDNEIAESLPL